MLIGRGLGIHRPYNYRDYALITVLRVNYKHIYTKELAWDHYLLIYAIRQDMLVNPLKIGQDQNAKYI
jgi:hypothetical protein